MNDPLKIIDSKFDISLSHDQQTLRPVPNNRSEFKAAISELETLLHKGNLPTIERARVLSRCGISHSVLGNLEFGKEQLNKAESLIPEADGKLRLINRIRQATNHQLSHEFEQSNALFSDMLSNSNDLSLALKATLLQHAGKNLFDQSDFRTAKVIFEKALDLRRSDGNSELVKSSELALKTTIEKLNS